MVNKDSAEQMIDLFKNRGFQVTEQDQFEIELFHKGRALQQIVGFYGWDVLREMIQSYSTQALSDLVNMPPGDERVLCAHAAASALHEAYSKLVQDIQAAIDAAAQTPEIIKRGYKVATDIPIESM